MGNSAFPVGMYLHRTRADRFAKHAFSKELHQSIQWLAYCEASMKLNIESRFKGQEATFCIDTPRGK